MVITIIFIIAVGFLIYYLAYKHFPKQMEKSMSTNSDSSNYDRSIQFAAKISYFLKIGFWIYIVGAIIYIIFYITIFSAINRLQKSLKEQPAIEQKIK